MKIPIFCLASLLASLAAAPALGQVPATPGAMAYRTACAACHLENFAGNGPSPSLAGADFLGRWQGLTGADLLKRIRSTMPANAPGSLRAEEYRAITGYLLAVNGMRTGDEQPDDEPSLSKTTIK